MHQNEYLKKAQTWLANAIRYDSKQVTTGDAAKDARILDMALRKACDWELMGLGFPPIYYPDSYGIYWEPSVKDNLKVEGSFSPKAKKYMEKRSSKETGRINISSLPM